MPLILVEYTFDPPITDDVWNAATASLASCLDQRHATWVTSYLSQDRTRRVCVYQAKDAEAVRQAYRTAGVSFDRAWSAEQITG
jgi:hypothetical protein